MAEVEVKARPNEPVENGTAQDEGRYHNYVGSRIPWYVHLMWVIFWCFATWYIVGLLLPALRVELTSPP